MVWIGAVCGVVTDALPETVVGHEEECDYCGDGCVQVAVAASEYEVDDPLEFDLSDAYDSDDERVAAVAVFDRVTSEDRRLSGTGFLHGNLNLGRRWASSPEDE